MRRWQVRVFFALACFFMGLPGARALDADSDGLSDVWQLIYDIDVADRDLDPDGDTQSNWSESQFGSNPLDPSSVTLLNRAELDSGAIRLRWSSVKDIRYQLERSQDMTNWTPVQAPFLGTGEVLEALISDAGAHEWEYRLTALEGFDQDNDTLTDYEEGLLGSNPALADTDLDTISDGEEFLNGARPREDLLDYYNGKPPKIVVISGDNQLGPGGAVLPVKLGIRITNQDGSKFYPPVGSAPEAQFRVEFASPGDGAFRHLVFQSGVGYEWQWVSTVTKYTDANGNLTLETRLPTTPGDYAVTFELLNDAVPPHITTFKLTVRNWPERPVLQPDMTLTTATPGATIYYTLDGSLPTTSSPVYQAGTVLNLTLGERLQARAWLDGQFSELLAYAPELPLLGVGQDHVVLGYGGAHGWGANDLGQLGLGSASTREPLSQIPWTQGQPVVLAGGLGISAVLDENGGISTWGTVTSGGLGQGVAQSYVPQVLGGGPYSALAAGHGHFLALNSLGQVLSWGENGFGQLGNGGTPGGESPEVIGGLSGVSMLAAGANTSYAIAGGQIYVWGSGEFGLLGNGQSGTGVQRVSPGAVPALSDIIAVYAGEGHVFALDSGGIVRAWGKNGSGQLGIGTESDLEASPAALGELPGVAMLAAGGDHSLAVTETGAVFAWGSNAWGQLGTPLLGDANAPRPVDGLPEIAAVYAGREISFAVSVDGRLFAWGRNDQGQLGMATESDMVTAPLEIALPLPERQPDKDSDGDGLDDAWEISYFGNLAQNAEGDFDGDTFTNLDEYRRRTHPFDVMSRPPKDRGYAVGNLSGSFQVSQTGAAVYSLPLPLPEGRNGLTPSLSLTYSSMAGNDTLGVGWSLGGLSQITAGPRLTKREDGQDIQPPSYNTEPVFSIFPVEPPPVMINVFSKFYLDGSLLVEDRELSTGAITLFRKESDDFSLVRAFTPQNTDQGPRYWVVHAKSGLTMTYGRDRQPYYPEEADMVHPLHFNTEPYRTNWPLSRIEDQAGNVIEIFYRYERRNRPFTEPWGGPTKQEPFHDLAVSHIVYYSQAHQDKTVVLFQYGERPDHNWSFTKDFGQALFLRLEQVVIGGATGEIGIEPPEVTPTSVFHLKYQEAPVTQQSYLVSITQEGLNGVQYRPLNFEYTDSPLESTWAPDPRATIPATSQVVDVNSDGLNDLVEVNGRRIWLNQGNMATNRWTLSAEFRLPVEFSAQNGTEFADIDGDGRVDFLVGTPSSSATGPGAGSSLDVYLNTGTGWQMSTAYDVSPFKALMNFGGRTIGFDAGERQGSFLHLTDLNGDGLLDILFAAHVRGETWYDFFAPKIPWIDQSSEALLNTGSGWIHDEEKVHALPPGLYLNMEVSGWLSLFGSHYDLPLFDANGDGIKDAGAWQLDGATSGVGRDLINSGQGWYIMQDVLPPVLLEYSRILDINGDGLKDIIYANNGTDIDSVSLNSGGGWLTGTEWTVPEDMTSGPFLDINGDGLVDRAGDVAGQFFINTGTGWTPYTFAEGGPGKFPSHDLNGDGITDSWSSEQETALGFGPQRSGAWRDFSFFGPLFTGDYQEGDVPLLSQAVAPRPMLKTVTDSYGASIQVEYSSLTDPDVYIVGSPTEGRAHVDTSYVVSAYEADVTQEHSLRMELDYEGLAISVKSGNLGFRKITRTNMATNSTVTTWYRQDAPFVGQVEQEEMRVSGGQLIQRTSTSWTARDYNPELDAPFFTYSPQQVVESWDPDGSLRTTVTTTQELDQYGNAESVVTDYGNGHRQTVQNTFTNIIQVTEVSGPLYNTKWQLGILNHSQATLEAPGKPDIVKTSSFSYDPATRLLASETTEPGSALEVVVSYTRDSFGNALSMSTSGADFAARSVQTSYDPLGRFQSSSENGLGHLVVRERHPVFGLTSQERDPNGLTTTFEFDEFGRNFRTSFPDGGYKLNQAFWAGPDAPPGAIVQLVSQSSGSAPSITYLDRSNNVVRQLGYNGAGEQIFSDSVYDASGRLQGRTEPRRSTGSAVWTTFTYDTTGRLIQTTQANGDTMSTEFHGKHQITTDAEGRQRQIWRNERGQVIKVEDHLGGEIHYSYDAVGNLLETVAGGLTSTFTYDLRDRKVSQNIPESGLTTYHRNALGEIVQEQNAANESFTHEYDLLGRLTRSIRPEGVTEYVYDTAPGAGLGKLASVSHYSGIQDTMSYDVLGRPTSYTRTLAAVSHTFQYGYDALGRQETFTYPSGFTYRNVYSPLGHIEAVVRPDTNQPFWEAEVFDGQGRISQYRSGNDVAYTRQFDPVKGFLTRQDVYRAGGVLLESNSYTYDGMGTLTARADLRQGITETFTHDDLYRLTGAARNGATTLAVTYNAQGNISSKTGVGAYTYGAGSAANTLLSVSGELTGSFTYDAKGNQLTGLDRTLTVNSFNLPTQAQETGGATIEFLYDGNGQLFRQSESRTDGTVVSTTSPLGIYEYTRTLNVLAAEPVDRTLYRHYIPTPTGVIAAHEVEVDHLAMGVTEERDLFLVRDHLGSVTALVDELGLVTRRFSFDAFGQRRNEDWTALGDPDSLADLENYRGYTGHRQLDAMGLIHMGGRIYNPLLGRMLSPDPVVQDAGNTQNFARYSYVLNNPLSLTDPSGFQYVSYKDATSAEFQSQHFKATNYLTPILQMGVRLVGGVFKFIITTSLRVGGTIALSALPFLGPYAAAALASFATDLFSSACFGDKFNFWDSLGRAGLAAGSSLVGDLADLDYFAGTDWSSTMLRTAVESTASGTLSAISGNSFWSGALSGAFQRLLVKEDVTGLRGQISSWFQGSSGSTWDEWHRKMENRNLADDVLYAQHDASSNAGKVLDGINAVDEGWELGRDLRSTKDTFDALQDPNVNDREKMIRVLDTTGEWSERFPVLGDFFKMFFQESGKSIRTGETNINSNYNRSTDMLKDMGLD